MEALEQQASSVAPPAVVSQDASLETSFIAESHRPATTEMLKLEAPPQDLKLLKIGAGFMAAALVMALGAVFMPSRRPSAPAAPAVVETAPVAAPAPAATPVAAPAPVPAPQVAAAPEPHKAQPAPVAAKAKAKPVKHAPAHPLARK